MIDASRSLKVNVTYDISDDSPGNIFIRNSELVGALLMVSEELVGALHEAKLKGAQKVAVIHLALDKGNSKIVNTDKQFPGDDRLKGTEVKLIGYPNGSGFEVQCEELSITFRPRITKVPNGDDEEYISFDDL